MDLIKKIREDTGASSNSEALRIALRGYGAISGFTHDGEKLFLQKDNEPQREVILP